MSLSKAIKALTKSNKDVIDAIMVLGTNYLAGVSVLKIIKI